MSDFSEFLKLVAEAKKTDPVAVKAHQRDQVIKEGVKSDLASLFDQLSSIHKKVEVIEQPEVKEVVEQVVEDVTEQVIVEIAEEVLVTPEPVPTAVDKYVSAIKEAKPFAQPEVPKVAPELKVVTDKLKFLEQWVAKISAAGPGSGEVNLRYLDDVDRPTIYDMRYLRYNDAKKKFEFAEVNPHDIVYTTTLVTTPTYTPSDSDYYIGVNYAGPTTITLPLTSSSGRMIIIKDESGLAETNPITVQGTVDNDAGGFIIQINNGATQLIYRNGWRIV